MFSFFQKLRSRLYWYSVNRKLQNIIFIVIAAGFLIGFYFLFSRVVFPKKTVYVIRITDFISYDTMDIDRLYNFLKTFHGDGILLYIDSPGGGVETYRIVEAIKNVSAPKLCYIHYYGTSGAYWICSQADRVVAEPYAITGSIGGIIEYLDFSGLLKKLGINPIIIKVGKYKDIGNSFRNITPEERDILYRKLKLFVDVFKQDVLDKRNITNVSEAFSGEWFFGVEAKKLGLIDELGDYETAKEEMAKLLNTSVDNINFVTVSFEKEKPLLLKLLGFSIGDLVKKVIIS